MNRAARRGAAISLLGFALAAVVYFDVCRRIDLALSELLLGRG